MFVPVLRLSTTKLYPLRWGERSFPFSLMYARPQPPARPLSSQPSLLMTSVLNLPEYLQYRIRKQYTSALHESKFFACLGWAYFNEDSQNALAQARNNSGSFWKKSTITMHRLKKKLQNIPGFLGNPLGPRNLRTSPDTGLPLLSIA